MEKPKEVFSQSCGMPMMKPEDFGGNDVTKKYCKNCAPDGELMSREEIREGWIGYAMKKDYLSIEAAKRVDEEMAKRSAWRKLDRR